MESSKVMSLVPHMNSGIHQTWTGSNGTFYMFDVEMENGHKGGVLGKSANGPAYNIGDTVEYEYKDNKISKVKKAMVQSKNSYYDDPVAQKSITIATCTNMAIELCYAIDSSDAKKGDFYKTTEIMIKWCYLDNPSNDDLLHRRVALKSALLASKLKEEEITTMKEFFALAKQIMEWQISKRGQ